jgi:hypothetical protein
MPNTKVVMVSQESIKSVNVPADVPKEKVEEIMTATVEKMEQHIQDVVTEQPKKTTTVVDSKDLKEKVPDVVLYGNPDAWKLICKASSPSEGWMKSTKAMEIEGLGILVQVSTQQGQQVAEALHFVRDAMIEDNGDGDIHIRRRTWEDDLSPTAREYRRREFLTEEEDQE